MKLIRYFYSQEHNLSDRQGQSLHVINELQRFRLLLTCLFCDLGVSLVYTFELFATEFTTRFGLTAKELSTISTVGPCFCYFVIHYAIAMEHIGSVPLLWWACVCACVGMLGLNLIFYGVIPGNMATLCIFYAFMNTCSGLFDCTSVPTLAETFPRNRGPVLSLAKVMTGLGASVMSCLYRNLFPGNIHGYLFFLMVYAMVMAMVASLVLVLPPHIVNTWRGRNKTEAEKATLRSLSTVYLAKSVPPRRLATGYIVAITLLIYVSITAPITAYIEVSSGAHKVIGALVIVIVCGFFLMILPVRWLGGVQEPGPMRGEAPRHRESDNNNDSCFDSLEALPEALCLSGEVMKLAAREEHLSVQELNCRPLADDAMTQADARFAEYTTCIAPVYRDPPYEGDVWVSLRKPDIYLIFAGLILQGAIGVMVMYNSGTIYVARAGKPRSEGLSALYTAFLGVGSALGRMAVGVYEAFVQRQTQGRRRFLVTMVLPVPPLLGMIGGALILVLPPGALLLPFIIVYFEVGVFFSANAIVLSSLWTTHRTVYYNVTPATTVLSLICFNRFFFGSFVDKKMRQKDAAAREREIGTDGTSTNCFGRDCILVPIAVAIALAFCAFVLLCIAHLRYVRYVRDVEKQRREASASHADARDVADHYAGGSRTGEPTSAP